MKRVLGSGLLIVMLLTLAPPLAAQVSARESRITITSDSPIVGFKTSSRGEQFSVIILSPVAPSTESDLAAGGLTDLQVSQEGGNVVVSFHLLQGAVARVTHNSNRVAIVIGFGNQARAAVPAQPSAALDDRPQDNGAQPNGNTNSNGAPRQETSPSAPPASTNGTTHASANASSTASTASFPAAVTPVQPASDAIGKQNLPILGDVDLAVPESPAFTILGLTPQTVVRPASPKEFSTALLNGVDEHGNFQSGLSFDAVPYLIFAGDGISLFDYNKNYLTRLFSRTQFSLATTKGTGDQDKSIRLGLGLHLNLWDKGDPRTDKKLFSCYDDVDQKIQADVIKFLTETPGGVKNPAFPAFLATQKTAFTTQTNKCDEDARKRNWKQSGLVIGAAPSWISPTGTTDKFRWNGGGFWTSLAYGFEGVKGLDQNSQFILHFRVRSREQVPDPANAGNFLERNSRFFGARLNVGNANTHASFEGVYLSTKRPGLASDNSYRYSFGLERRVAQDIWFQLSLGGDSGRRDGNNQAFIKGTFNWGFTRKQERDAPAAIDQ